MAKDRAKHTILPPSKFGLVQVTRQRVRPELAVEVTEDCPSCKGSGKILSTLLLTDEIENNINRLLLEQNEKYLKMTTHPFIHAYLTRGFPSLRMKWYFKYKKWVHIQPVSTHHYLEYYFFNRNEEEIKIS
jgi:ribonuclease G